MRDKTFQLSTIIILWVFCGKNSGKLLINTVPSWREPGHIVTLNISFSPGATNPLKIGQTVNVTCVMHNNLDEATVELMQVTGRSQRRILGHRSPLTRSWNITAADHGTQLYCGSVFSAEFNNHSEFYCAQSDRIPLEVEGVAKPASEPDPSQRAYVRVKPDTNTYNQYTKVQYVCDVENIKYPVVVITHRKGHLEYQLYIGYQTGFRWITQNVTTADEGTEVYCEAHTTDSRFCAYSVLSEPHKLTTINH